MKKIFLVLSNFLKIFVGRTNETNRHAWVETKIRNIPKDSRILDAGAGEQRYKELCSHLVYTSQDIAQYDGIGDGTGLQTGNWDYSKLDVISNVTNIPFQDGAFDAILCTEVLEHIPEPTQAITEFSRLLRQGGQLILTAPFCSITHFAPYHFSSGFNRYYYETIMPENHFEIIEISRNGNYFEYFAQELLRLPGVSLKYADHGFNVLELFWITFGLIILNKLTKNNLGSEELLCYGYHIHAFKI